MSAVRLAIFSPMAPNWLIGVLNCLRSLAYLMPGNQGHLRGAADAGAQLEPADIEDVEGDLMAFALLAEEVLHRHLAVVEDDLGGGRAFDAELLLFGADDQAGEALLDQEGGEMLLVDLGEDGEQLGKAAVGDELLGAVQDIVLAVVGEHRRGLGAEGVAAGAGLGQTVGGAPLAGDDLAEILFLLGLGAVVDERQGADAGVGRIGYGKGAAEGHLLTDQHGRGLVQFQAAVLFRGIHHQQAQLAAFLHAVDHDVEVLLVDLFDLRSDLGGDKLLDGLAHLFLLVGKILRGENIRTGGLRNQVFAAFQYFFSHYQSPRRL